MTRNIYEVRANAAEGIGRFEYQKKDCNIKSNIKFT